MMENSSGSVTSALNSHDSPLARLAVLGAVAVTAALTARLAWPARRDTTAEKHRSLIAYLREHLSGSDAAMQVVRRLSAAHQSTQHGDLFRRLSHEFEEERAVVQSLLTQLGASTQSLKRVAGYASGSLLSVTAGGQPGDLSLFRTLEALAIGVQGKRCMWRTLQSVMQARSLPGGTSFEDLESKAVRQWEAIEQRRRDLTVETFPALASDTGSQIG